MAAPLSGLTVQHTSNSLAHYPEGTLSPAKGGLQLLVSIRFQVLFHSPNRSTFHLSLTVLLHYRLRESI